MLVEEYLSSSNLDLDISTQWKVEMLGERSHFQEHFAHEKTASSVQSLNSNILQVCLLMEGIGNAAVVSTLNLL